MLPLGPDGVKAFSKGFFDLAAAQKPKPQTVAILAADAEFARTSADGARENAAAGGFRSSTTRATRRRPPISRRPCAPSQAANPDVVFVAAYPPDTVGIVRAANEIGLKPKMFGGTMIGLLITPIKMQLGPILDGLVIMESFVAELQFPRRRRLLKRYRAAAAGRKDRSARLRFRAVRLRRRPGSGAGRRRHKEPRSRQARRLYAQPQIRDRRRRHRIRQGRRMDAGAHGVHAIPARRAERHRTIRRRQKRSRCSGRRNTRPAI